MTHTDQLPGLRNLDWAGIAADLDGEGVALTPPLLSPLECVDLARTYEVDDAFRATVDMARHQFGRGRYRYFAEPLPPVVQMLRTRLYPPLAAIANEWAGRLGEPTFPTDLDGLLADCAAADQHRPTPLLLRYGPGDYNCLHQDVYGNVTFPLQVAILLSTPEEDFTGGENVFVEQRPRAQSRPVVVRPGLGQGMVFPVRQRPVVGNRGYKRLAMRHGVSTVRTGERFVLGVIFHNSR